MHGGALPGGSPSSPLAESDGRLGLRGAARLPKKACLSPASRRLPQPRFPQRLPVGAPPGTAPGIQRALGSQKAAGMQECDGPWVAWGRVRAPGPTEVRLCVPCSTHSPAEPKAGLLAHETAPASRPGGAQRSAASSQGRGFPLFLLRRLCAARWPSLL